MYKIRRLPSKRSHFHMGDAQLKTGYNSILSAKKDVNLRQKGSIEKGAVSFVGKEVATKKGM